MDDHTPKIQETDEVEEPVFGGSVNDEEIRLDENGDPIPLLTVLINSGYGRPSYSCVIQPNGTMILPDGLARELGMEYGDDLEWNLNEDEGVIYVSVVRRQWEVPEFLDPEEE